MLRILWPVFGFLGAHTVLNKAEHERDRAWQRVAIGLFLVPLSIQIGHATAATTKLPTDSLSLLSIAYGAANLIYLAYLRVRPHDGVIAQYTFILLDPIVTMAVIAWEPSVFSWFSVLLLLEVVRCGVRFGIRTMVLEWAVAAASAAMFMLRDGFLSSNASTAFIILAFLAFGVPSFIPLIRIQHRTNLLAMQDASIKQQAASLAAKSEFLSKVSHELRSPLQAILSALDLIELRHQSQSERALVERVRRAARGITAQLGDLLTLARSEAGSLTLRPQLVDLKTVLNLQAESAMSAAEAKSLALVLVLPASPVIVVIDAVRVDQILENMLANAIKYTDRGRVTLELKPWNASTGCIGFSVTDTGSGIEKDDLPIIFAPYERARAQAYTRESAGVGLAVVQALLAHMGGKVTVQSEPGVGSAFHVELPAAEPRSAPSERDPPRLLVVDDREDVLMGLAEVARALGYVTDVASGTGSASNLLAARHYSAVLIDLQMPVKTGDELARDIRRIDGPNRTARLIAMTAADDGEVGRHWPFDAYLHKPVSARMLTRALVAPAGDQALTK